MTDFINTIMPNFEPLKGEFWECFVQTLIMIGVSGTIAWFLGVALGVTLVLTRKTGITPHPLIFTCCDRSIDVIRSVPFIILMVLLIPLSRLIVGTGSGLAGSFVALVFGTVPFFARQIEQVLCDGENYGGARPCHYEWVKLLRQECVDNNVTFVFCGTGRRFVKDGRLYKLEGNIQSQQAKKSGMSFRGKPIHFDLYDSLGYPISEDDRYKPVFRERCETCGMQMCCNGCSNCGKCE